MIQRADLDRWLGMLAVREESGELSPKEAVLLRKAARHAYKLEAPRRKAARRKVYTELEAGRLRRPGRCAACGTCCTITVCEGHHPDHAQPLVIEWLCAGCHDEADTRAS